MGDCGSLTLGILVAILGIQFNEISLNTNFSTVAPILSTAIVFVPFFDMVRVFFLRIIKGKSPFYPDMNHLHHRFLAVEKSHIKITLTIVIVNIVIILLFYFLRLMNVHLLLALLLIFAALLPCSPALIRKLKG
jgi:UDP-N-acetylmuramyl pentapeptide phosphotransferase/UDP-N-acetylglucosamine-1-phosphate transferase